MIAWIVHSLLLTDFELLIAIFAHKSPCQALHFIVTFFIVGAFFAHDEVKYVVYLPVYLVHSYVLLVKDQ